MLVAALKDYGVAEQSVGLYAAVKANIVVGATTKEVASTAEQLAKLSDQAFDCNCVGGVEMVHLCDRIQIAPGKIRISISVNELAALLEVDPQRVSEEFLEIASAFQHRKRGVETKLILTDAANPRDETLFRNIAKAHRYFEMIRAGKSYAEIAKGEGVSKHRIHKLLGLAFLAPDVVCDVFAGTQPTGLTTEWVSRHAVPTSWNEQRDLFRSL